MLLRTRTEGPLHREGMLGTKSRHSVRIRSSHNAAPAQRRSESGALYEARRRQTDNNAQTNGLTLTQADLFYLVTKCVLPVDRCDNT